MSTIQENQKREERSVIYGIIAVILIALVVIALVAYRGHKTNVRAEENADKLIALITAAGYPAPDKDAIIGVLGDDGGSTCEDPGDALSQATLNSMIVNGAAGPGSRPIIADSIAVRGQLAIISVYCPDELDDFQDAVKDGFDFDDDVLD